MTRSGVARLVMTFIAKRASCCRLWPFHSRQRFTVRKGCFHMATLRICWIKLNELSRLLPLLLSCYCGKHARLCGNELAYLGEIDWVIRLHYFFSKVDCHFRVAHQRTRAWASSDCLRRLAGRQTWLVNFLWLVAGQSQPKFGIRSGMAASPWLPTGREPHLSPADD